MLSIIIPVGPGRDAHQALSSLLTIGLDPSDEVIVVGDGHSLQLDEAFQSLQITLAATSEPMGANAARNLGARMATGEVLCFLDDDDQYEANYLAEIRSAVVDDTKSGAWSLGYRFLSGRNRGRDRRPSQISENCIQRRNIAGGCSCMVLRKATFVESGGFDDAMASMQDWDFWIRLSRITSITTIKEPLIIYNDSESPRISTNQAARISGLTRLLEKNAAHWPKPVIAFHEARLAAAKFSQGTGKWFDIFHWHAPVASLAFACKALRPLS